MRFASFASTQAARIQSESTRSPLALSASRASSRLALVEVGEVRFLPFL